MPNKHPLNTTIITQEQADTTLREFLASQMTPFKAPTEKNWPARAEALRKEFLKHVVYKGLPARLITGKPKTVWADTIKTKAGYSIRKLRYEIYPDYWVPALLYVPDKIKGKAPVMINPNGHTAGGKAADYKQARCANLARRGVYALNLEFIGMGELLGDRHHNNLNHLNFVGISGVGLFYLAMQKGLDICLAQPKVDKTRVGITGLSGGGWQSIFFAPLDNRINLCVPVAGYTATSKRLECNKDLGDSEQTPTDMACIADYDTLTAMLAGRVKTLIIANEKDECCFRTDRVKPVIYDAVAPTFKALGKADEFEFYSNSDPGTHNYLADNRRRLYEFLNKHWKLAAPEKDLHTENEIFSGHDLEVGMPASQLTMMEIARRQAYKLSEKRAVPKTVAQKEQHRQAVAQTIRLPDYPVAASSPAKKLAKGISSFTLQVGPWVIPVVKVDAKPQPKGLPSPAKARIILDDHGRKSALAVAEGLAKEESYSTLYFVDIMGLGELNCTYLLHLVAATVGQRSMGIQVAQLLAVTRFICQDAGVARVDMTAVGYSAGAAALVTTAMEPGLFANVTPRDMPQSFRYFLDMGLSYDQIPAVLCWGLFETTDIRQLKALSDGVTFHQSGWDLPSFAGGR